MTSKYKRLQQKKLSDLTIAEMIYLNSCECLYYGAGYDKLNKCGLGDFVCKPIWEEAKTHMGDSE